MRFHFHDAATAVDLAAIVRGDEAFMRARRRMVNELGFPEARADQVLQDMLGQVLLRYGNHLVAQKSVLVDKVIDLRGRLDTLYGSLLNFTRRDGTGGRMDTATTGSVDDQLRELGALYDDLDTELSNLGKPFHEVEPPPGTIGTIPQHLSDEIAGTTASTRTQAERAVDVDLNPTVTTRKDGTTATRAARILSGRYKFTRNADGSYTKHFADQTSAVFRVRDGRYHVEVFDASGTKQMEFSEYGILQSAYARRPRTSALMQSHHGLQNSHMTRLFKAFGYDGGAAPTIWLRNSRSGSPHASITAVQNGKKAARGGAGVTYTQLRAWALADLLLTDMPHDQIKVYQAVFDNYFESAVLPNIPVTRYDELLGTWRPQ